MTIKVRLASFTSNAGDTVEFSSSGVTCLVGGNNAGKSRTLSDIAALIVNPESIPVVLTELILDKPDVVNEHEAETFLRTTAVEQPMHGSVHRQYMPLGTSGSAVSASHFSSMLAHGGGALSGTAPFFFQHWTAGSLSSQAMMTLGHSHGSSPSNPLHQIFIDGDLEEELSNLAYEAFEEHLTLDRANMDVRLRVGKVENIEIPLLSHPTRAYAEAVAVVGSPESSPVFV